MKFIILHETKNGFGTVASVVGMSNYQVVARNEIDALSKLLKKLEHKDPEWIKKPRYKAKGL